MSELLHTLSIDPKVIAAQIIGFILLWIVLARFLFRPVLALLGSREQDIKTTYDTAESTRAKAEELQADYEKRLAGIEAEARSRIQAAVKEAEEAKSQIISEARSRSEDILRRGQEDLAREREKTLAEIREQVVDIAISAAGKVIGESMDEPRQRRLVNDFIDRIGVRE